MVAWELHKIIKRTLHDNDEDDRRYDHYLIMKLEGTLLNDLKK